MRTGILQKAGGLYVRGGVVGVLVDGFSQSLAVYQLFVIAAGLYILQKFHYVLFYRPFLEHS